MRLRNATLIKRNNVREKFMLELKEGSKILEDQLRLMDRRYLELRAKLDWTRHHADRQVKKAKAAASTLRAKWALATNSQQGLLDNVPLPDTITPGQSQLLHALLEIAPGFLAFVTAAAFLLFRDRTQEDVPLRTRAADLGQRFFGLA